MEAMLVVIVVAVALLVVIAFATFRAVSEVKERQTDQRADLAEQKSEMLETLAPLNARLGEISAMKHPINELNMAFAKIGDRGYIGEMQLQDIVRDQLPAKFVQWQTTLPDGKRPDCLLDFPPTCRQNRD